MNIKPKLSVIIPAYMAENYIRECIESVLSQNYPNVEIIVIDNNSTDNTADIAGKYPLVKVFHEKRQGVAYARNCGLSYATGEYILFLDSDDFLSPDTISILMENVLLKNVDIIRFRLKYIYGENKIRLEKKDFENNLIVEKKDFFKAVYKKMIIGIAFNSVCRCLYKASVIKDLRFDTKLSTAEDLLFNIHAFTKAKNFLYLSEIFYCYRKVTNSLTGKGLTLWEKYRSNLIISKHLISFLEYWGENTFYNRIMIRFRLIFITFSKIKRISQKFLYGRAY